MPEREPHVGALLVSASDAAHYETAASWFGDRVTVEVFRTVTGDDAERTLGMCVTAWAQQEQDDRGPEDFDDETRREFEEVARDSLGRQVEGGSSVLLRITTPDERHAQAFMEVAGIIRQEMGPGSPSA